MALQSIADELLALEQHLLKPEVRRSQEADASPAALTRRLLGAGQLGSFALMSTADWALVAGVGMCLIMGAPLFIALYFAMLRGHAMPRRWLFVLLVTTSSYGFFVLSFIVIWVPIEFLVYGIAPISTIDLSSSPEWFDSVISYGYTTVYIVALLVMIVYSVGLTRFLWRRWPRIAEISNHER